MGRCLLSPPRRGRVRPREKGLLHPSPGGTCAELANTAIPKELQSKPEALAEIYVGFYSSVRNQDPSVCSRLRDSYKFISFS